MTFCGAQLRHVKFLFGHLGATHECLEVDA